MITLLRKLFNHDKIDDMKLTIDRMQQTIESYKVRNNQLEEENREYKGYKLKYEVTKLYVDDDEALIELFDIATKHDNNKNNIPILKNPYIEEAAAKDPLNLYLLCKGVGL